MTTTVGSLVQRGRDHDPAFTIANHPHRVALAFLSTRHQELLKALAADLKDRLSEARSIATEISGELVGVDAAGVAYTFETSGDGYDVIVGSDGIPYLGSLIAFDPFADGFPLPANSLHIIDIYATMRETSAFMPITVVPQLDYSRRSGVGGDLLAVINGWRLMPLRNPVPTTDSGDTTRWASVTAVTVVWIDTPVRFEEERDWEAQLVALPDLYAVALEYELAAHLASREYARDPKNFPAGMVTLHKTAATEALARAMNGVRTDHKGFKTQTTRRNR